MSRWRPTTDAKLGVVVYDYPGRSDNAHYLPLKFGEVVRIVEQNSGWYRGFCTNNPTKKGIFPASFIHLKECIVRVTEIGETVESAEDPVAQEVAFVLREWNTILKQLYKENKSENQQQKLRSVMAQLMGWRTQIMSGTIPAGEIQKVKKRVTSKIDWGNRALGLDLIPRDEEGRVVNEDNTSVISLYKVHQRCAESMATATPTGTIKNPQMRSTALHHLLVNLNGVVCIIGEDMEVFLSLFDLHQQSYISERYVVKLSRNGSPKDMDKLGKMRALFTDLGNSDLRTDVYLVCHIIRVGKMQYSGSSDPRSNVRQFSPGYRRPFACAVLDVSNFLVGGDGGPAEEEKEHRLPVFQAADEDSFSQLHMNIIKKVQNKYKPLQQSGSGVFVSLKLLHGSLSSVKDDYPHLVQENAAIVRKLGFPEVIMPDESRNDLYITLEGGDFQQGSKTSEKNIEATLEIVSSETGDIMQHCICPGEGEGFVDQYKSLILYHNNSPKWNETVKLAIPINLFYSCHLRFTFRHRPTNPSGPGKNEKHGYSLAFVKLMNLDGTTLQDTRHDLIVYNVRSENKVKLKDVSYLRLRFLKDDLIGKTLLGELPSGMQVSMRETFSIATLVCSTKLTHNVDLLGLLKWRNEPKKLENNLRALMKVGGEEIVKFLQDTFDALFAILDEHTDNYGHLVFEAIVYIIGLLSDRKYHHFRPVLESYIDKLFSNATANMKLLKFLRHQVDCSDEPFRSASLLKTMRALEYIFRFVVRSRILFDKATRGRGLAEFKHALHAFFHSFTAMMLLDSDTKEKEYITPIQAAALQHFPSTFQDLKQVMDVPELSKVVVDFISSIPRQRMTRFKMLSVRFIVSNELFRNPDAREILMPMVVVQLDARLDQREELPQCIDILAEMLTTFQSRDVGPVRDNVTIVVQCLLKTILKTLAGMERSSSLSVQLTSVLLALLKLMDSQHFHDYVRRFSSPVDLREFVSLIFDVFYDLVSRSPFPHDWFTMSMLQNSTLLTSITYLSEALLIHFMVGEKFNSTVWNKYFHLGVAFVTQESLQIETMTSPKASRLLQRYGDMRVVMNRQILNIWDRLGDYKINFVPELVGPFVEMSLIQHADIRRRTIRVFLDTLDCELRSTGDFRKVETELIDKLDTYVSTAGRADDHYKDLLSEILTSESKRYSGLLKAGLQQSIDSITQLLSRLLDFRNVPDGDEHRNLRMSTIFNLLQLYREMEREEMYIRYIYKLCDMHLKFGHFSEAAFTLLLHAKKLEWSVAVLASRPPGKYQSATTEGELKEMLYHDIIDYLDKGKLWEHSIARSKEVAEHYETVFDYARLSKIYRNVADFYDKIAGNVRAPSAYYRVGFFGKGFPSILRNKIFIYRGGEYEKIGDFNHRLLAEFPHAQLMKRSGPPGEDTMASAGQFIQTCTVDPVREDRLDVIVPETIREFHAAINVDHFQVDRPFHRGTKDKENEFATLWIERTTYQTMESLPGILRWSEVHHPFKTVEICPIENAIESVANRNQELRRDIDQCEADPEQGIKSLGMKLNGVIDAAVNGGVAKYEQAFLVREYHRVHPEHMEYINVLTTVITEQVKILGEGLVVHSRHAPETLMPLQNKMEEMYGKVKRKYGSRTSSISRQSVEFRDRGTVLSRHGQSMRFRAPESHEGGSGGAGITRSSMTFSTASRPDSKQYLSFHDDQSVGRGESVRRRPIDPLPPIPHGSDANPSPKLLRRQTTDQSTRLPLPAAEGGGGVPALPPKSQNRSSSSINPATSPLYQPVTDVTVQLRSKSDGSGDDTQEKPPKPPRPPSYVMAVSPEPSSVEETPPPPPPKPPRETDTPKRQRAPSSLDVADLTFGKTPVVGVATSQCLTELVIEIAEQKPDVVPKFRVESILPEELSPVKETAVAAATTGVAFNNADNRRSLSASPRGQRASDSRMEEAFSPKSNEKSRSSKSPELPPKGNVASRLVLFSGKTSPSGGRKSKRGSAAPSETDV